MKYFSKFVNFSHQTKPQISEFFKNQIGKFRAQKMSCVCGRKREKERRKRRRSGKFPNFSPPPPTDEPFLLSQRPTINPQRLRSFFLPSLSPFFLSPKPPKIEGGEKRNLSLFGFNGGKEKEEEGRAPPPYGTEEKAERGRSLSQKKWRGGFSEGKRNLRSQIS